MKTLQISHTKLKYTLQKWCGQVIKCCFGLLIFFSGLLFKLCHKPNRERKKSALAIYGNNVLQGEKSLFKLQNQASKQSQKHISLLVSQINSHLNFPGGTRCRVFPETHRRSTALLHPVCPPFWIFFLLILDPNLKTKKRFLCTKGFQVQLSII